MRLSRGNCWRKTGSRVISPVLTLSQLSGLFHSMSCVLITEEALSRPDLADPRRPRAWMRSRSGRRTVYRARQCARAAASGTGGGTHGQVKQWPCVCPPASSERVELPPPCASSLTARVGGSIFSSASPARRVCNCANAQAVREAKRNFKPLPIPWIK